MRIVTVVCDDCPLQVEMEDFAGLVSTWGMCLSSADDGFAVVSVSGSEKDMSIERIRSRLLEVSYVLVPEFLNAKLKNRFIAAVKGLSMLLKEKMTILFEEKAIVEQELMAERKELTRLRSCIASFEVRAGAAKFLDTTLLNLRAAAADCRERVAQSENILSSVVLCLDSIAGV